jgi:Reverse transcriptase (RNA-dependent DNA polymerase)
MKKAFDSLSHDYIKECLKFFGFGPYITDWVTLLSTNRLACIQLEKNIFSKKFRLSRGNAQGDVISPFLFNLGYQILLLKFEMDNRIEGLYKNENIPEHLPEENRRNERRVFAFADDGNILVSATANNLNVIKKILSDFYEISGLECNIEKSVMMQVGNVEVLDDDILNSGFRLEKKIKILGATINGECKKFDENFLEMDEKVQKQINTWSRFNLSLTGRINIAKTMMYSQLNYNGCFLPPLH